MMDMEEEKMMTKEHMEAELKSLKIKRMIARILAVCAVLMAIFMAITEDPTIALVFLVIALVLWLLTSRATKRSDKIGHALDNVTSTEQMDTRLQFMRIKVIILRILTHGLLVTGILAVPMNFFITLACLIIAPVFGIPTGRAIRRRDEVKEILGRRVSSSVVRDVLGYDVEYDPAGALTPGSVVIPPHYDRAKGTHHISTVCNGVNIEMGSIMLLEDTETTDAGGNPLPHVNVQFRGPWVICDYGRKPACSVFISERTKKDYPAMKSNVKIENEPFGSRFCVRAKDPQ